MQQKFILFGLLGSLIISGCSSEPSSDSVIGKNNVASEQDTIQTVKRDKFGFPVDSVEVSEHEVKRNESLYLILNNLDFNPQEIYSVTQQAKEIVDIDKLKPGQTYRTYASADSGASLSQMVWQPNNLEYVVFDWQRDSLEIYRAARPLIKKREVATATISTSLYEAVEEADSSPLLAYKMAEIFAWQINFFGLRKGDSFEVVYNKRFVGDEFVGIGDILAAKFVHRGETYNAYRFKKEGVDGYFTEDGESVEKALLKAPFKFSQRISSHFSHNRYHPILKKRMPHYGVDYAAPTGTPVLAVGDGVVTEAQRRGANGNIVKIDHNASYKTAYLHLQGFASGIRKGAKVKQGQIIGYVGSTGRSTGSHLDYRLYKNDRPVNPLTVDLPSSEAVPESLMSSFKNVRDSLNQQFSDDETLNSNKSNSVATQTR